MTISALFQKLMYWRRWASDEEASTEVATTPSAPALPLTVLPPSATPVGQAMAVTRRSPGHRDLGRSDWLSDYGGVGLG